MHYPVGRWRIGGWGALVALAAVMSACSKPSPYSFGVVLGGEGLRGAELAAATVNARGGIKGHRVELVNHGGSSTSGAQEAIRVADLISSDPSVLAVIGHSNSSASLAASQVYNSRHLVQIAPTTTAPLFSQAGPGSFRLVASDEHQAAFIVKQIVAGGHMPRVAMVYVNDDYGRPLRQLLHDELRKHGVPVVYEGPYVEGEAAASESEVVRSLAAAKPEVLIWAGRPTGYVVVAQALHAALPKLKIIASDGFGGVAVEEDPLHRFDGVQYVRLVDLQRPDSALQAVRSRYRADGGADLSDQAALAYDAVMLLSQAVTEAGANREAIREWLSHVGRDRPAFHGITGPIGFPEGGDRSPTYVLTTAGAPRADRAR